MVAKQTRDEQLRAEVVEELEWDSLVDASQVDVAVDSDVVTLVGTVASYAQLLAAQKAARAVAGVHDILNEIDVKPSQEHCPTDDELQHMAQSVLRWDALTPDQDITVSVADGWVALAGAVAVDAQRREAHRAIGHLAGVRGVTNSIAVHDPDLTPDDVRDSIRDALQRRASQRARHIDITVEGTTVTLQGRLQSALEKVAILGAVSHAPGIERVCDDLLIDPNS
jgi:osmotically-inducible protein OsmY